MRIENTNSKRLAGLCRNLQDNAGICRELVVGSWQFAVGSWQLVVGSWQLAVGSLQLAVGSWQLAMGGAVKYLNNRSCSQHNVHER